MFSRILFFLIALSGCSTLKTPKRAFNLELHGITWTNITSPVKDYGSNLTKLSLNRYSIDLWAEFDRQLTNKADVGVLIHVKTPKARKPITFLDIKINVCDGLNRIASVPLIMNLWREMRRKTNLPTRCPLKANFRYTAKNFIITNEILPIYTPILSFNHTLNFYDNQQLFGRFMMQGSTVPR